MTKLYVKFFDAVVTFDTLKAANEFCDFYEIPYEKISFAKF